MRHRKIKSVFIALSFSAVLILALTAVFIVSENYQSIYNKPRVENAIMNCAGFDRISEQAVANPMSGEWEFFYGKWIISDNEEAAPDSTIKLPKRWTGMKIDGKRLPKTGYASYRMKIVNLDNIEKLRVYINRSTVSYRVFINNELNVTEGTVSKNISETFATAVKNTVTWYYPQENEELTVVIEVSNNNQGGLYLTPWFDVFPSDETALSNYVLSVPKILFGGMVVLLLFCFIVPFGVTRKENYFTFPILLTTVVLHFLTAKEMSAWIFELFSLNYLFVPFLRYITGVVLVSCYLVHLYKTQIIRPVKAEIMFFSAANIMAFITYFIFSGSTLQIIPIAVSLASLFYLFYKIAADDEKKPVTLVYLLINFILLFILIPEAVDGQGLIVFGFETAVSTGLVLLIAVIAGMCFYKMRESQKKLILAAQLEKDIAVMKVQALKAQINPHFIFNSLSAIQNIYKKVPDEGEQMISRFAEHLRINIDADKRDLVPFEKELANALNYFELENLHYEKKLTLLLNIEFSDFLVPLLSLQPLLENAIKHGDTQNKDDGKIEISAYTAGNNIIIKVSDNGCGFDMNIARSEGVGLRNVIDRLKYLLDATVSIKSAVGYGTSITITIPKKGGAIN